MRVDRPTFARRKPLQRRRMLEVPVHDTPPANLSPKQRPLDWRQAVRVAAFRLSEKWVLPATGGHPAIADMAQRLAALFCAYGKLSGEVDRMEALMNATPSVDPLQQESSKNPGATSDAAKKTTVAPLQPVDPAFARHE